MSDEKPPEKGKRKRHRLGEPRPGPRTADLAFGEIMGAILDADPEAVREHRRQKAEQKKGKDERIANGRKTQK